MQCEGCGPVLLLGVEDCKGSSLSFGLVMRNDVIPVEQDVRGLLREWRDQDLAMKTVSQCKFSEQFGNYFFAGSEQAFQQFYVIAKKVFRAVVRQIGRATSGGGEQCTSMAPWHPMLICHGSRDGIADSIKSLGGALSKRGMLSAKELEKMSPQCWKLCEVQKQSWQKKVSEAIVPDLCHFCLAWDGFKNFTGVNKMVQVMIVTASGGGHFLDFEDLSLSCFEFNEVSSAVKSVLSFFRDPDVAACAFFENMMMPGFVEKVQKLKQLQNLKHASPWYGVSERSRELRYDV